MSATKDYYIDLINNGEEEEFQPMQPGFRNIDCMVGFKYIPDSSIDCCITDCPYKIIAGGVSLKRDDNCGGIFSGKDKYVSDGTACSNKWIKKDGGVPSAVKQGKMFNNNDIQFSTRLPELYRVMKDKSHTYIMINGRNLSDLQIECENVGFEFQNLLVRDKGNLTPNKYYMQGVEYIIMLKKNGSKSINHMGSSNIIRIPNPRNKKHPTEKPISLYEYLLLNSTQEGDIVLDPFAGCGNVMHACGNHNRECIAFEIDTEYHNKYISL